MLGQPQPDRHVGSAECTGRESDERNAANHAIVEADRITQRRAPPILVAGESRSIG